MTPTTASTPATTSFVPDGSKSLSALTGTHDYRDVKFEGTISHQCGVTLSDSVEARVIAEVMEARPGVRVTYLPAIIRIDGEGRIVFDMRELSEALGKELTPHQFEVHTSTHYGRMVMVDDETVVVFGNMDEALPYIEEQQAR